MTRIDRLISIIIPVYNVEKYITKCIQSLLDQTYKNFEAIIVDDGSPDNSIQIAKSLVGDDSRFIFLEKENGGQASARNMGLDYAIGEYIVFLDSDDYLSPDTFQLCINAVKCDSTLEVVLFGISFIDQKGKLLESFIPDINKYYIENDILLSNSTINYSVCNKLFKRDCFVNTRFFENITHEDKEILPKILYGKHLLGIPKNLYFYVQSDGSTMRSYNAKSAISYLYIYNKYKDFLVDENIYEKFRDYYERSYIKFCYFVELTHIIKYSPDYISDYKYLISILDPKILSLKNIRKYFSVTSKFYWFAILLKLSPNLAKRIYKCMFRC